MYSQPGVFHITVNDSIVLGQCHHFRLKFFCIDFMSVSSYGSSTESSGVVRMLKDLDSGIEGRNVLIVEDIIDTGLTLDYLKHYHSGRQPAGTHSP